jgi:lysyl-tRNA synthetase class 2
MLNPHGLQQRSRLVQAIRLFFLEREYIEVDTPIRLPVLIPEANLIPFASEDCFLQTSPELCMKRLLAQGCERIFQICPCFRKEEHGRRHQSEFTMLEWYQVRKNYFDLMEECELLLASIVRHCPDLPGILPDGQLRWQGCQIDLTPPWERLTLADAFGRYAGKDVFAVLRAGDFDEVLVTEIEPQLGWEQPVFLYDYPVELASLARRSAKNPAVAERFELYIAGLELANGFSELLDPVEQRQRFVLEQNTMRAMGREIILPEKFLAELGVIGEAAGIALGIDRLCMVLTGTTDIAAARPFAFEDL